MTENEQAMRSFAVYGDFIHAEPYGTGHINSTYKACFDQAGRRVNYLFQRINHEVFHDPETLMENIARICDHLALRADSSRRVLTHRRAVGSGRRRRILALLPFHRRGAGARCGAESPAGTGGLPVFR